MEIQEDKAVEGEETTLLFLDTLMHGSQSFNLDEIIFKQPVILQLIRIVKADSNPHPNLKHLPRYSQPFIYLIALHRQVRRKCLKSSGKA